MKYSLSYGLEKLELDLQDSPDIRLIENNPGEESPGDAGKVIGAAMTASALKLEEFLVPGDSLAIIVSDQTRPTGSEVYLPVIIRVAQSVGVGRIAVILAQGLHRPATLEEVELIFGGPVPEGVRVVNHDAHNGLLQCGDAFFRREAVEADKLVVTGAVTFHPMAGFSGGRKSLLPGIASADDIRKNHRLYFSGVNRNPACAPASVEGNPVRDDLTRRTKGFRDIWALNVVLNEQKDIIFASCGDIDRVWSDCCSYVEQSNSFRIDKMYENVITSAGGYPSDFSFYQSMKVLTNSSRACVDGGKLIVLSECSNGWEIDGRMLKLFALTPEEVAGRLISDFRMDVLGMYMAMSIINSYEVWLHSSLPRAEVESAGMHYLEDISIVNELVSAGSTAVIKNGSSILPVGLGT